MGGGVESRPSLVAHLVSSLIKPRLFNLADKGNDTYNNECLVMPMYSNAL